MPSYGMPNVALLAKADAAFRSALFGPGGGGAGGLTGVVVGPLEEEPPPPHDIRSALSVRKPRIRPATRNDIAYPNGACHQSIHKLARKLKLSTRLIRVRSYTSDFCQKDALCADK